MNRVQLATILDWAGDKGFEGRKRLQKIVFFLQEAGCPLDCKFTLHHFGPYSRDVAETCDEMVAAGLIDEIREGSLGVVQYSYTLKPTTFEFLKKIKPASMEKMQKFETIGKRLLQEKVWTLELGSTILFYYRHCGDWATATDLAIQFKKVSADNPSKLEALNLAKSVVESKASN